jgi:porin
MSTPVRGRALAAALVLAVAAPTVSAQDEGPLPPPTIELELSSALDIPPHIPAYLPGTDALDRLVAPTLIPLPGAESFGWFADAPTAPVVPAPALACDPCAPPVCLPTFGGSLCCRPKLTGDWGGLRSRLASRGVLLDVYNTNFFSQVLNGGLQETFRYRGRWDALLNTRLPWRGSFLTLHGEAIYGDSINRQTGTLLPVSLAQHVPVQNGAVAALTGVKFTQYLSEQFMVYGGKLNMLDEFRQPFTGGGRGVDGFWNTAFLFNPVLARTIPYSTYGFGAAIVRGADTLASFTVLDANNTPTTIGLNHFFDNGVVLIPSVNVPTNFLGKPGHHGLMGTWSSRRYFANEGSPYLSPIAGVPFLGERSAGAWSLAYNFDQTLVVSPCDPCRSWGVFGNAGLADTGPSPVRWFAGLGLGGSSPLQARRLDTFGVGYFYLGLNDSFKRVAPGVVSLRDEHGIEAFYNYALTPWCRITPDFQFIVPARRDADTMWFVGLRAKLDF